PSPSLPVLPLPPSARHIGPFAPPPPPPPPAGGADVDDALHDVGKRGWIRDTGLVSVVNFRRGVNRRTLRLLP
ncbi:MAG: hypothetical protein ACR2NO_03020, partial [Chloroflexota bacterium]